MRLNPSPDVQRKIAAAIEACTNWKPQSVGTAKDAPAQIATIEAQVCDLLDRWPAMHDQQQYLLLSQGATLGIGVAVLCAAVWTAFRRALGDKPLASVVTRFTARAIGGALCGVGVATLVLLFTLHDFQAATLEQVADQVFLSWARAMPWTAAGFALLFVLSATPSAWVRRSPPAGAPRPVSPWQR